MDAAEEHRKEALRRKGQEFLEKAISQASTKSSTTTKSTLGDVKIVPNASSVDPALETVGVVVEGLKDYIAALVFVLSSAASLVLAKVRTTSRGRHAPVERPHTGDTNLPQHTCNGRLPAHAHRRGGPARHVCHGRVYARPIFVGIPAAVQRRGHLLRLAGGLPTDPHTTTGG